MARVDERTHLRLVVGRVADHQLGGLLQRRARRRDRGRERSTRIRLRAVQSWPALSKTAERRLARELLQVGVGEDDVGAFAAQLERDLLHVVDAASRMISWPVVVSPVKATLPIPGCAAIAAPADPPGPVTTFTTPGGKPASSASSAEADRGQRRPRRRLQQHRVAGRQRRPELPGGHVQREVPGDDQARPRRSARAASSRGRECWSGSSRRNACWRRPRSTRARARPRMPRSARWRDRLAHVPALGLGELLDVAFLTRSANFCSVRPRFAADQVDHGPSNAFWAAATARSTSAGPPSGARAMTSPVAGLVTSNVCPSRASTCSPPMIIVTVAGVPAESVSVAARAAVSVMPRWYARHLGGAVIGTRDGPAAIDRGLQPADRIVGQPHPPEVEPVVERPADHRRERGEIGIGRPPTQEERGQEDRGAGQEEASIVPHEHEAGDRHDDARGVANRRPGRLRQLDLALEAVRQRPVGRGMQRVRTLQAPGDRAGAPRHERRYPADEGRNHERQHDRRARIADQRQEPGQGVELEGDADRQQDGAESRRAD